MKCPSCGAYVPDDMIRQQRLIPILAIAIVAFVIVAWGVVSESLDMEFVYAVTLLILIAGAVIVVLWFCRDEFLRNAKRAIHLSSRKTLLAEILSLDAVLTYYEEEIRQGMYFEEFRPHIDNCRTHLHLARSYCDNGDVVAGWRTYRRAELFSLNLEGDTPEVVKSYAIETLCEARRKLRDGRLDAVKAFLQESDNPPKIRKNATFSDVFSARKILLKYDEIKQDRLTKAAWQLGIMIVVAFASLVFLAYAVPNLSSLSESPSLGDDWLLVPVIIVIGAMGGATGGFGCIMILFASKERISSEQELSSWMVAVRPLVGAILSFVAALFLISGLLTLGTLTLELLLSVSFVAGFSEELVIGIVKKLAALWSKEPKEQ